MKKYAIALGIILLFAYTPILAFSETIDVLIKGVDDGIKTNKQQDYKEAVMNAKLQAIERAGVEIQSITKVVNFQTKFDMVESKAKAVLMPGFQVMDMDYQTDGTYQVVLVGKVRSGGSETFGGDAELRIFSPVLDASVFVDGTKVGFIEDKIFIIKNLVPGAHKIRVSKKGYYDFKSSISLKTGINSLDIDLLKPGNVYIRLRRTSKPNIAKDYVVYLDDKELGTLHYWRTIDGYAWIGRDANRTFHVQKVHPGEKKLRIDYYEYFKGSPLIIKPQDRRYKKSYELIFKAKSGEDTKIGFDNDAEKFFRE